MKDKTGSMGEKSRRPKDKGVFERPPGSGIFWVRYKDEHGREHRERVGRKKLAIRVYEKRRTEVQERRFFPEQIRRRDLLLKDVITEHLGRVRGVLRSYLDQARYGRLWTAGGDLVAGATKGADAGQPAPPTEPRAGVFEARVQRRDRRRPLREEPRSQGETHQGEQRQGALSEHGRGS